MDRNESKSAWKNHDLRKPRLYQSCSAEDQYALHADGLGLDTGVTLLKRLPSARVGGFVMILVLFRFRFVYLILKSCQLKDLLQAQTTVQVPQHICLADVMCHTPDPWLDHAHLFFPVHLRVTSLDWNISCDRLWYYRSFVQHQLHCSESHVLKNPSQNLTLNTYCSPARSVQVLVDSGWALGKITQ